MSSFAFYNANTLGRFCTYISTTLDTYQNYALSCNRNTYAYPVSLVSPPILLQTRVEKTNVCENMLGSELIEKVWKDTTAGVTCGFPYACDEELLNSSNALMSCSSSNIPPEFLGQPPQKILGKLQYKVTKVSLMKLSN
jgi:hypothetical protein